MRADTAHYYITSRRGTAAELGKLTTWPGWDREPVNLFVMCCLPPGERKSQTFSAVLGPVKALEAESRERAEPAVREAEGRLRVAQKRFDHLEGRVAKANSATGPSWPPNWPPPGTNSGRSSSPPCPCSGWTTTPPKCWPSSWSGRAAGCSPPGPRPGPWRTSAGTLDMPNAAPLSTIPRSEGRNAHLAGIKRVTVTAMVVGLPDVTPESLKKAAADILTRAEVEVVDGGEFDASLAVTVRATKSDAAPGLHLGNVDTAVFREVIVPGDGRPVRCTVPVASLGDGGAGKLDGMGAVLAAGADEQVRKLAGKIGAAGGS